MRLSPGQVADLRAPKNARGQVGGAVLYSVVVEMSTFERAQVLTTEGAVQPELSWYVASYSPNRMELHTTHPEWFAELEEKINAARRPARP